MGVTIMSSEQQVTFGEIVGLPTMVPVRRHPDDIVHCVDGVDLPHRDVLYDCRDFPWSDPIARHEANVEIVAEVLDAHLKWAEEYATENEDYADGYACILSEGSHYWKDRIEEWYDANWADCDWKAILVECEDDIDHTHFDEWMDDTDPDGDPLDWSDYIEDCVSRVSVDSLLQAVYEDMDADDACDVEYGHNEYARYSGPGLCLDGFDIGECEEQVSVMDVPEFKALHESGELDDCLDDYNGDAYVCRSRRRVKNEETGYYEQVGRETYNAYGHDYPTFEFYYSPGGRWDFIVPADRMNELFTEALVRLFQEVVS
jgi:hypothetical protein